MTGETESRVLNSQDVPQQHYKLLRMIMMDHVHSEGRRQEETCVVYDDNKGAAAIEINDSKTQQNTGQTKARGS